MSPKRIQREKTKGWRMPENTVYVGRGSTWRNPFIVAKAKIGKVKFWTVAVRRPRTGTIELDYCSTEEEALNLSLGLFEVLAANWPNYLIHALKGQDLCCWCPLDKPCHADILLKVANQ